MTTGYWDEAASNQNMRDWRDARALALKIHELGFLDARQARGDKLSLAQKEFALAHHSLEKNWTLTISAEAAELEGDLALVEAAHTQDLAGAAFDLANN